jgi:RHS repeat-associated protein
MSLYYERTSTEPLTVDMGGGKVYTLKQGERFETDSACELLQFMNAPGANPSEGESGFMDTLLNAAATEGCIGDEVTVTADQAAAGEPTTEKPPADGDSATDQGAPDVPEGGSAASTEGEQQGGGEDEPRRPPEGEVDPALTKEQPQGRTGAGDPVDIFTGAFVLEETDIEVPNVILPLALTRTYHSGPSAFGAFGWNWDHNYNLYLRELSDGSVSLWRNLHEDVFEPADSGFEPPPGVFERLEPVSGFAQVYELVAEGGNRMHFERPPGWIDAERIPISRLEDRHGNTLTFTYGQGDKLAEVRDADDRYLQFEYDACGLLVALSDHAGRRYVYVHDEETEQLVAVSGPPTTDYPDGVTRLYRYPEPLSLLGLRHNIVSVEDTAGNVYLENSYDEDPSSPGFGRLTEQLYGDYLFQFRYTQLQWLPPNPVYVNVPSVRVEVMNPDFGLETYTFNYRGDLLDRRFRLNKDDSFRVVAIQYEFDTQGNLTTTIRPDGSQEILIYDVVNADPGMRRKLLQRELVAAPALPAPSRIVWRGRYEPVYGLLIEETNEVGAKTTYRYDFDLTPGAASNTGKLKQILLPDVTLPDDTVQPGMIAFEHNDKGQVTEVLLADGSRQELEYGTVGNARSRLIRRTFDPGGLGVVNEVQYDAFGFDSTTIDGNGNVTRKEISALGLMEAESLPAVDGVIDKYTLHYSGDRRLVRVERPRGAYVDASLAGDWIVDVIDRDVLGYPIRCELSANTGERRVFQSCFDYRGIPLRTRNPDGSRVDRIYDERGLLIDERITGSDGVSSSMSWSYDINGQLSHVIAPGDVTTSYEYDGFGRLTKLRAPSGTEMRYVWLEGDVLGSVETVGDDGLGNIRRLEMASFSYDKRLRATSEGIEAFVDDPGTAVTVTTTFYHDPGDRVMKVVDHRGGIWEAQYDGLGRVSSTIDPAGNEERFLYDANSNLLRLERHHREPGGTTSILMTSYTCDARNRQTAIVEPDGSTLAFEFDARDLLVGQRDHLGRLKRIGYNSFGDRVLEEYGTGGAPIVHQWELDAMSRVVAYVDPTGEISRYKRDGIGRIIKTDYPSGYSSARTYDTAGNVVEERLGSGVRFEYAYDMANRLTGMTSPTVLGSVVPIGPHAFAYDGLDRVISATVGSDPVIRRYDSRGRIVREEARGVAIACAYDDASGFMFKTWPDGRAERHERGLDYTLRRIEEVAHGALGSGGDVIATLTPSGPGYFGAADYQGNLHLAATYDDRKRLAELAATSTSGLWEVLSYRYDTANTRRVESLAGTNPRLRYFEYDEHYRLTTARAGFTLALPDASTQADHDLAVAAAQAASAGAPEFELFHYDSADARLTYAKTGQADRTYAYVAGHRPVTDGLKSFTYSDDAVLQSDGEFAYQPDALGRIVSITADAATVCDIEYDALGRPSIVHETGRPARTFNYLGEFVEQETEDGAGVRQYTVDPASGMPIAYHVSGATFYALFDGGLNLIGLADTNGALLESYRYEAFGLPTVLDPGGAVQSASQFDVEPIFGGQRFLQSGGRYLAKRRLMNPDHGIFLSPDPLGYASSPSPYVYAAQDPIDLADSDGDFPFLAVLAIMAVGAVVAGGLNATRQAVDYAENPRRRQEGFSWGELGTSMATGAVLAPVLVIAPELALPLTGYGVYGGIQQIREKNYATGTFDIVTSLAPFAFRQVRNATWGSGTVIGWGRGTVISRLGGRGPWQGRITSLPTRTGRFTLVENNLRNFAPAPFGRRIGLGFAPERQGSPRGHTAVIVERPGGGFSFFEKNGQPVPGGGPRDIMADFTQLSEPPKFYPRRTGLVPFEYDWMRVPRESASEAMNYARERISQTPFEKFDVGSANCANFAGDVLAKAGFRGMGPGNASGLFSDFTNFNSARAMSYSAPFWVPDPNPPSLSK